SNSLELKTFAEADGDGWRLNGEKIWITAVDQAEKMLVIARTKKVEEVQKRTDGLSMFMIDVKRDGLTYHPIDKVGTKTLSSCTVFFDDVRIGPEELVGTLHGRGKELLDTLSTERFVTVAGLVGAGSLARRVAVDDANEREVCCNLLVDSYQVNQFPHAQAKVGIECPRLTNFKAAA